VRIAAPGQAELAAAAGWNSGAGPELLAPRDAQEVRVSALAQSSSVAGNCSRDVFILNP
jgi:hypothetical protein